MALLLAQARRSTRATVEDGEARSAKMVGWANLRDFFRQLEVLYERSTVEMGVKTLVHLRLVACRARAAVVARSRK